MATLLELSTELQSLENLLESVQDLDAKTALELQESISELFSQKAEIDSQFYEKIDNYLALIQSLKSYSEQRKLEAERLRKLADSDSKKADFLKQRLMDVLTKLDIQKLKTKRFNLSIASNGGKQPIWISQDVSPKDLPQKFKITSYFVDKEAVRKALENGENLEFAHFEERGKSLRIK